MTFRLTILSILICSFGFAQTPDDNWVFGYFAQINFGPTGPTDSGGGPIDTDEGSGTISDSEGNLLFSTDGMVVRDRFGDVMPNGTGLNGNFSSTQNTVIVPFPGDYNERFYYIFTVAAQLNGGDDDNNGLEYVVVDMEANGGLGDVTQPSTELLASTSEKIHATYQPNNRDVWVVVHEMGSADFYAFPIDCNGIGEPVVSTTGTSYPIDFTYFSAIGTMKISPDGSQIASTYNTTNPDGSIGVNYLEYGSFNNATGVVEIEESLAYNVTDNRQGYGLEFSPDNNRIYWSVLGNPSYLYQFTTSAPDLEASQALLDQVWVSGYAGMQLGPDGAIYLARTNGQDYLSVINNPNDDADDIIIDIGVTITNMSKLGLPNNWMYPYPEPEIAADFESTEVSKCIGEPITLIPDITGEMYVWSDGSDGPTLTVSNPGVYSVTINEACATYEREFVVNDIGRPEYTLEQQVEKCENEPLALTINTDHDVIWYNGSEEKTIVVNNAGQYRVEIFNESCSEEAFVNVVDNPLPRIESLDRYTFCEEKPIGFTPIISNDDMAYLDGIPAEFPYLVDHTHQILLRADNECGMTQKLIQFVEEECGCELYIPNAITANQDGVNDVFKVVAECPFTDYVIYIYDRWGTLQFQSNDPAEPWLAADQSGYHLPPGIYPYRIEWTTEKNGFVQSDKITGHVQVLR